MNWSYSNIQYALLNEYAWEKKINWLRMFFIVLGQWWWLKQKKRTKKKKKRIWVLDILKRSNIGIRKLKIYITHLKYYQSGISKWPHMIKPGWCLVNKGCCISATFSYLCTLCGFFYTAAELMIWQNMCPKN